MTPLYLLLTPAINREGSHVLLRAAAGAGAQSASFSSSSRSISCRAASCRAACSFASAARRQRGARALRRSTSSRPPPPASSHAPPPRPRASSPRSPASSAPPTRRATRAPPARDGAEADPPRCHALQVLDPPLLLLPPLHFQLTRRYHGSLLFVRAQLLQRACFCFCCLRSAQSLPPRAVFSGEPAPRSPTHREPSRRAQCVQAIKRDCACASARRSPRASAAGAARQRSPCLPPPLLPRRATRSTRAQAAVRDAALPTAQPRRASLPPLFLVLPSALLVQPGHLVLPCYQSECLHATRRAGAGRFAIAESAPSDH